MVECIEVFMREKLISVMYVDYSACTITIDNKISQEDPDWIYLPFGRILNPDWDDYTYYISTRCFPRERGNCKELLKLWGLDSYDPDQIVRKTHAVMNDDFVWLKFEGETLNFEDVRMR